MICPNCGNTVNDGESFCGSCGTPVNSAETGSQQAQPDYTSQQQPDYTSQQQAGYTSQQQAGYTSQQQAGYTAQPQQPQPVYVAQPANSYQDPRFDYTPIGMWGYFGYEILFSIPCVGFVLLLVFSFGGTRNINVRNFARSYFCFVIVLCALAAFITLVSVAASHY